MKCPICGSNHVRSYSIRGSKKRFWCLSCHKKNGNKGGWFSIPLTELSLSDLGKKTDIIVKEEGNHIKLQSHFKRVMSLDDLIDATDIDLKIWSVDKWIPNSWEVTSWRGGKKEVSTNYQIKAWLSKKKPDKQIFPTIEPLNIRIKKIKVKVNSFKKGLKTALIFSDSHNGFRKDIYSGKLTPLHDRRIWDLFIKFSVLLKPDIIVLLGDMMDMGEYSDKFIKSPDMYWTTQPTLIELGWYISRLRQLNPNTEIHYMGGNHEERIQKLLINHYVAGWDLKPINQLEGAPVMSPEFLLDLENLGVNYIGDYPKNNLWLNDNIEISHGNKTAKESTDLIKGSLREIRWNRIMGHNHKISYGARTLHECGDRRLIKAYCLGVGCHVDGRVPSNGSKVDWQQGFGVVTYDDNNSCDIENVSIYNGNTIFRGELFRGNSSIQQMMDSIDWKYKDSFLNDG